jgi:biopolymer transport protein TolR
VMPGERYLVNKEPLTKATLGKRLKEIYDGRPEKIIFVKGDPKVKYSEVIYAMDVSRGSGVKVIGMSPKETAPEAAPQ